MELSQNIDFTTILTWIISVLMLVAVFFLKRFFDQHDRNMVRNSALIEKMLERLAQHDVDIAVGKTQQEQTEVRVSNLENRGSKRTRTGA